MSDLTYKCHVDITLADFINVDASGKYNVIGGGVTALGFDIESGASTPFAVMVAITLPHHAYEKEFAFELLLRDEKNQIVELPGPAGSQKMRIAQNMTAKRPTGGGALATAVPPVMRFVINLSNGIPLRVGSSYSWEVRIDGDTKKDWSSYFIIPDGQPGVVFG